LFDKLDVFLQLRWLEVDLFIHESKVVKNHLVFFLLNLVFVDVCILLELIIVLIEKFIIRTWSLNHLSHCH